MFYIWKSVKIEEHGTPDGVSCFVCDLGRFSLRQRFLLAQTDADFRSLVGHGGGPDGVAQAAADPAAQVQPDAAGPGVPAAVEAREPPVEDPGQVLRCDAHAGVPDAQVIAVHGDGHGAADGVFQGVGQHLLHHEAQPLGVGDHGAVQGLIVQPQTAADELPGELPHRRAHDIVQAVGADHIVGGAAVQPHPPYVDLRVSKITDSDIEEVDIEAILKSYEITLWNLKTDEEYEVPEGKKVTVRIPVPEGAQLYESLIIAHYMEEKGEYEYFVAGQNLNLADGYLVFETASFSPFNIGGNQLVGIGTKSPNHKPSVSYYSDATAGSLTMVPAAGNTMASSKTASNSGTKKNSTDSSVKSGIVVASSGIGTNLNRSSSGQSDSSVTPIEKPILLTSQGSGAVSESTTASTSASSNAKTGDSMNLFAWMGTAVASFAIMVKADLTRKRRRKSRKYMKK